MALTSNRSLINPQHCLARLVHPLKILALGFGHFSQNACEKQAHITLNHANRIPQVVSSDAEELVFQLIELRQFFILLLDPFESLLKLERHGVERG